VTDAGSGAVTVRTARASDAAAAGEVFRAARAGMTYLPRVHTDEETRAHVAGLVTGARPPASGVAVAEIDGRPVGFAHWSRHGGGWLHDLYVHPGAQRRGAGSALLDVVERTLPDGFSLWLFQANQGARRLYHRRGCYQLRETDGAGNEERTPDALLRWPGRAGARVRPAQPSDVPTFFAHHSDPASQALAGYHARDRATHDEHWARTLAAPDGHVYAVEAPGGVVVGSVVSWPDEGRRLVGYAIGREHWGRGYASAALGAFCAVDAARPLHAFVAEHNVASRRVLEKCGFVVEERREAAGDPPLDELLMRLDAA
jgi:RimJ/RimL family protein N-acetyltransferase